jgi:hypothetical protein
MPPTAPLRPDSTPFNVFTDTNELCDAVDEYLAAVNPENSAVAAAYGYPIGAWDVSGLTDFSSLFDAWSSGGERNPAAKWFNEDLSGWNMEHGR